MNAARLLALYERIADAPDAIARLRRFVLDLAVRGKLVPQDAANETASATRLRSDLGKRQPTGRTGADLGPVRLEEVEVQIPPSWRWSRLFQICEPDAPIVYGILQPGTDIRPRGVPYIRPSEIELGQIKLEQIRHTAPEIAERYMRSSLKAGDIVFTIVGTIGASAIVPPELDGSNITQSSCRLRADISLIDPQFLLRMLRSGCTEGQLNRMKLGTAVPRLNIAHVRAIAVPLPPLAEQHRIVAKVDELMALCDRLEAARVESEGARDRLTAATLARLNTPAPETFPADARFALNTLPALTTRPDQIKHLRQTILNLAVRGKLVPQDPNDDPAPSHSRTRAHAGTPLPASWRYTKLADLLSEDTRNGYSRRPDDAADGVPILRISAGTVRRDGVVAEEEHKRIGGIDSRTREEYGLRPGDLLACRFNGNKAFVGRLTIFEDYLALRPIYPDKLIRVRPDARVANPSFLRLASETDLVRAEIEAFCATTVGNWGISASNLKEVRFPVPPLAEQHRIVAKVNALMALCDALEQSLTAATTSRTRLLEATLAEALAPASLRTMDAVA